MEEKAKKIRHEKQKPPSVSGHSNSPEKGQLLQEAHPDYTSLFSELSGLLPSESFTWLVERESNPWRLSGGTPGR